MYYLMKVVRKLLLELPLWLSVSLGRILGLLFYLNSRKRKTAFKNIKMAFPQKKAKAIRYILKRSLSNFGLSIIESLIAQRMYQYVELKEKETIYEAGGIFVGIHAGSWEMAISYWAKRHKLAILVEPQKHRGLNKFLDEVRQESKIYICYSMKELLQSLKKKYMVGLVIDHGPEDNPLDIEFFGHLVPTPTGAIYLAKKFNKKIYTTFCFRKKGIRQILEIGPAIDPQEADISKLLKKLNMVYENYLGQYPWEYFWCYKRFKHKRDRNVVILSDAKTGHLKQAKALLELLKEKNRLVKSKVIEIRYKNRLMRILADIFASFAGKHDLFCGRLLSFLVTKNSWEQLDTVHADIVISAGSFVASLNKLFASYLGAKSAVILRPNIPLKKFDLAIIPEHDRIQADNAVMIKGALFWPQDLEQKKDSCKRFFNLGNTKKIAVFLGGALTQTQQFLSNLKFFVSKLRDFSLKKGYKILFSTSRRTPCEIENYLEKELINFVNVEALVMANRNNYDFVFEGFSVLADIIFVSSESISMISEIASLKKPCICVSFEEEDDKRKVFLESMAEEIVLLRKPYDIELIELRPSLIFEKNKKILEKAIQKLL